MSKKFWWVYFLLFALPIILVAQAAEMLSLRGNFVTEGVTGRKVLPHGWSEELIYAISLSEGVSMGVRTSENPPGLFTMPGSNQDFPGFVSGHYALFTLAFDRVPAFAVNSKVRLSGGSSDPVALNTPAHYSVMYDRSYDEWGESPWVSGTDFYQTFTATSAHITRIATKLAGKDGDHQELTLNYAVYEPNDGPPSKWKRISPIRSVVLGKNVDPIIHIHYVIYRSSEVNLVPGKKYAVRFWRDPSSPSPGFSIVARRDNKDGYASGHLYSGDKPLPDLDAYAYVSGGEPGTVVNHAPIGNMDLKEFSGSAQRFGQTFKATGIGLAGVDIIYADGNLSPKPFPVKFQLYDRPGGKAIGPSKTCYGLPLTYQARAAAIWKRGEVPLTPGRTYYIEWTFPAAVNSWFANENLPGDAYRDGKIVAGKDFAMSIAEYEVAAQSKFVDPTQRSVGQSKNVK
jgi:hypothetical protein